MIARTDKFKICSSFTLSNDDIAVLSLLYLPIIKSTALSLYMTFYSLINRADLSTEEYSHVYLIDLLGIKLEEFINSRRILEGMGLISTYEKDNNYIYLLRAPLQARRFLNSNLHGLVLYSTVGQEVYENLRTRFKVKPIDKKNYQDISVSFDEVFNIDGEKVSLDDGDILVSNDSPKTLEIKHYDFNFSFFASRIDALLIRGGINEDFKQNIITTASNYSFDEADMESLFKESIDIDGYFSQRLLKKKAKILYTFKTNQDIPKFTIKEKIDHNPNYQTVIEELENCTGEAFLQAIMDKDYDPKYLVNLNELNNELKLDSSVIRIMVMYVLKVLNKRNGRIDFPALSYFKKVEDDWILKGYTDVYKAYDFFLNGEKVIIPKKRQRKGIIKAPTRIEQENRGKDIMEGMDIL